MQTRLSDAAYLDALDTSTRRVGALAAQSDPTLDVPSCPGWNVRDLLEHLGGVHAWARNIVGGGNPKDPKPALDGDPAQWYDGQAAGMLADLRAVDPGQSCWTFRRDEPVAAFWLRRQLHETEMHLLDLAFAAGAADDHLPATAADGITETLDVMLPRMNRDRPIAITEPILLHASDTDLGWLLRPNAQPATVDYAIVAPATEPAATQDAAVRASAPAHALLTGLWRRTPYTEWQIDGTPRVLDELMSSTLTP